MVGVAVAMQTRGSVVVGMTGAGGLLVGVVTEGGTGESVVVEVTWFFGGLGTEGGGMAEEQVGGGVGFRCPTRDMVVPIGGGNNIE